MWFRPRTLQHVVKIPRDLGSGKNLSIFFHTRFPGMARVCVWTVCAIERACARVRV